MAKLLWVGEDADPKIVSTEDHEAEIDKKIVKAMGEKKNFGII